MVGHAGTWSLSMLTAVRLVLAFFHAVMLGHLSRTIRQKYGATQRNWFMALSLSQLRLTSHTGRVLPEFIVLPLGEHKAVRFDPTEGLTAVVFSISLIFKTSPSIPAAINQSRYRRAVIILSGLACTARLELGMVAVPTVLSLISTLKITRGDRIRWTVVSCVGSFRESVSETAGISLTDSNLRCPCRASSTCSSSGDFGEFAPIRLVQHLA